MRRRAVRERRSIHDEGGLLIKEGEVAVVGHVQWGMNLTSRKGGAPAKTIANQLEFRSICVVLFVGGLVIVGASLCVQHQEETMTGGLTGAPNNVEKVENSLEIHEIGEFAVKEHNTKEGKNLTYKKVVTARTQVVSGVLYHLILEASHGSEEPKQYNAKVWLKTWENHKSLEHFEEVKASTSVSSDTQEVSGLRDVSVEDPVIKEAAEYALKKLNNQSNSLIPYELKDILSAQAEATDEETQIELYLKVSRGTKEEEVKAGISRTAEGKWTVKHSSSI